MMNVLFYRACGEYGYEELSINNEYIEYHCYRSENKGFIMSDLTIVSDVWEFDVVDKLKERL